ncbi:MAG: hypothetical protein LBU15_04590 [Rickettsiales bacterium]|nr:hypothetical protein [Rickettsiales bacterium]
MSKKEEDSNEPSNVISPRIFGIPDNTEAVPYLNNNCDGMQDMLSEVEKNTLGLQKDFMARESSQGEGNVVGVDFSKDQEGRPAPNI